MPVVVDVRDEEFDESVLAQMFDWLRLRRRDLQYLQRGQRDHPR